VIRLYSYFGSKEFLEADSEVITAKFEDYDDFVEKYGPSTSGKPIHLAVRIVGAFFEGIGVLLHRRLVDIDLVAELFSVKPRWEKMKPIAEGTRKQYNEPRYLEWFEYLYNEIQKREQRLQQM